MSKSRVVVVLGMHRSGTSALTRGLKEFGVELGSSLMPPVPGENDRGYWEDIDISALNDDVLDAIGCGWDSLRLICPDELTGARMDPLRLRAARLLTDKFAGQGLFGFKDPRTCRLLPFWQRVFGDLELDDRYIVVTRNPLSVASSLAARDGFSPEKSHLLWLEHMIPAMAGTRGRPKVVVDYDRTMDDPVRQMKRISTVLGARAGEISEKDISDYTENFLTNDLRHTRFDLAMLASDPRLPELTLETYRWLLEFTMDRASPDAAGSQETLQRVERVLASLAPVYDLLDREMRELAVTRRGMKERNEQISALNQALAERDGRLASVVQILELTKMSLDGADTRIRNFQADLLRLGKRLHEEVARLDFIERSTFWRFTAHIRAAWRFLETSLLRRNLAFRLVPSKGFWPLRGRHEWQATDNDAHFDLVPLDGIFPTGWVLVSSSLRRAVMDRPVKLYLDAGEGMSEPTSISLPATRMGTVMHIVAFPKTLRALKWVPLEGPGELCQGPILMSEVSAIERNVRMLVCVWRVMRAYPSAVLHQRGLTWRRAFSNLADAHEAALALLSDRGVQPFR